MIPISIPHLYKEDKSWAKNAINEGFIANGPNIALFEKEMAFYCNRRYAITCSNGTVALYLAIKALNLPIGSEVILPTLTIVSCLTAITENGLTPVFCDSDIITWNVSFESLKTKITSKTSAIILVDMYGLILNVNEVNKLKREYPHIKIIEDASEAHGSEFNGTRAGSIGNISTFSFYANKIITTGEGGMVLTDDEGVYDKLCLLRNLNFIDRKRYIHSEVGFNFRLNNISCCIGLGQLKNIDKTIKQRRRIAKRYSHHLNKLEAIQLPYSESENDNVFWYYTVIIKENIDKILTRFIESNIDYRHTFYPLHKQPFINSDEILSNAEYISKNGIILPTYTKLTNKQIDFICGVIKEVLK